MGVLQSFATRPGYVRTMPTPQQIRAQVFTALTHGATGIIYFAIDSPQSRNGHVIGIAPSIPNSYQHPGIPNDPNNPTDRDLEATPAEILNAPTLWAATVALNKELQSLQDAILSPTSTLAYGVAYSGSAITSTPLRTMLKRSANGVYTLLVMNVDNVPLSLKIDLPAPPIELFTLGQSGDRYPKGPYGSAITDSIEGFGVRNYEFK